MSDNTSTLVAKTSDQDILAAIQENGYCIGRVEKTPERCLAAVRQNGLALGLIPEVLHTADLCIEAAKQNGRAIQYVSKKVLSYDICLEAVRSNGAVISDIPVGFKTEELYFEAISHNGKTLEYVPKKYKSESLCMKAVMQNGLALQYVPSALLSNDFCLAAVEQNGLALKHVPNKDKNEELCITAVNNDALALEYVPKRFMTSELCNEAIRADWKAFLYAPRGMYTLDNCRELFEMIVNSYDNPSEIPENDCFHIEAIVERLSSNINNDIQIINLERQLGARHFKEKLFDKNTDKFVTKEHICYLTFPDYVVKEFKTFTEFYEYLGGNLKNANLHDFDFRGVNLKNFNIEGACISSAALMAQNLYDDSFYAENIRDYNHNTELMLSAENEEIDAITILHESDINPSLTLNDYSQKMYYVSDIHLNHKILKKFPSHATEQEVIWYIREYVDSMVSTTEGKFDGSYLLIAGDISFNFEISAQFYAELAKLWYGPIIVVLGNHELWNCKQNGVLPNHAGGLEEVVQRYRDLFDRLNASFTRKRIHFLQNDLLFSDEWISGGRVLSMISEEELIATPPDVLREICLRSPFAILGGLGFSGLNPDLNATHGLYRDTIKSLNDDIEQTKRFARTYHKINEALGSSPIIVLTHTPKENWSNETYNSNWVYVNGHTHQNDYYCDDEKTVYADNQIGYHTISAGLKHFNISQRYDIFKYYEDGIYTISRGQYLDFNRGKCIKLQFNKTGKIHMLKRHGIYCFLYEKKPNVLCLLSGGMVTKLEQGNINYYFEKMVQYSEEIKAVFGEYRRKLESVSDVIKRIGGTGTIHGCIVDISYFSHIYINPTDGKIIPYFALSIMDKWEYSDVSTLLLEKRPDLYDNCIKLLNGNSEDIMLLKGGENESIETPQYVPETDIYKLSRKMRQLQYLLDANVIRIWSDQVQIPDEPSYPENQTDRKLNEGNHLLPS